MINIMKNDLYKPDVLTSWRNEMGMTQEQLAEAIGYARISIARAELGKQYSPEMIFAWAAHCNKDYADALTDKTRKKFVPSVLSA